MPRKPTSQLSRANQNPVLNPTEDQLVMWAQKNNMLRGQPVDEITLDAIKVIYQASLRTYHRRQTSAVTNGNSRSPQIAGVARTSQALRSGRHIISKRGFSSFGTRIIVNQPSLRLRVANFFASLQIIANRQPINAFSNFLPPPVS